MSDSLVSNALPAMVLDSNIIIGYLNGDRELVSLLDRWWLDGQHLFISTITITEVLSLSILTPRQIRNYQQFLRTFLVLAPSTEIAEVAARLRREYRISVTDALIAATAMVNDGPLVTRDDEFSKIRELSLIVP